MNRSETQSDPPVERTWQQTIDKQVDGELSDQESRELLAVLDGIEGGWRRLALAYVESQWLRCDLPALVENAGMPRDASVPSQRDAVRAAPSRRVRLTLMTLAVAASLVVAFGLSLMRGGTPQNPVATTPPGSQPHAVDPAHVAASPVVAPAAATIPVVDRSAGAAATTEPRMVVIGSDGENDQFATMPPRVIEALRRMGHRVEQQRGVMPVKLKDGRSVEVPYDQVDLQYRGSASFQ